MAPFGLRRKMATKVLVNQLWKAYKGS